VQPAPPALPVPANWIALPWRYAFAQDHRIFQCVVGNQLAALNGLEKRVMEFAGEASAFVQPLIEAGTMVLAI